MRKIVSLTVAVLALSLAACGPGFMIKSQAAPQSAPSEGKALVTFVRPSKYASGYRFMIIDSNLKFLGESWGDSQFTIEMDPGKVTFVAYSENVAPLEADLAAGKRYYVHVQPTIGAFAAQVQLKAIKPGSEKWDKLKEWLDETTVIEVNGDLGQQHVDKSREKMEKKVNKALEKMEKYEGGKLDERVLEQGDGE